MNSNPAVCVGENARPSTQVRHGEIWWLWAVAVMALVPAGAMGATAWELTPRFGTELSYETNPSNTSRRSDEDDVVILMVVPEARMAWRSQKSSLNFNPQLRFRDDYGNDSNYQLDGTDVLLPASARYRGLRSEANVGLGYSQIPSREADYQVVNPNTPLPPGGVGCAVDARGRCKVDETQTRWYINPGYTFNVSPRSVVDVNGGFTTIRYDEAEITGRYDYDYINGSLSFTRLLTEQHRLSLSFNADRFEADQDIGSVKNTTDTLGVSLGYEYALSPATSLTVSGGASVSDFSIDGRVTVGGMPCFDPNTDQFVLCETKGEDSNFVGELFLRQQLDEAITAQVGISRSIQPNSDGAKTTVDYATAFIQRSFSQRLSATAGVSYTKQEAIGASDIELLRQRFDRDYYRLELGTSWQLSRNWSISGKYTYYFDDQSVVTPIGVGNQSVDSRNHIFGLGFQYVGLPIR